MKVKSFSEKKLAIIILLSVLVLLGGYVYLYILAEKMFIETGEIRSRINVAKSKNNELQLIRENIKSTLGTYELVKQMFVPKDGVVDFIQTLEALGRESGLSLTIKTVENKSLNSTVQGKERITIFFSADGDKSKLLLFLKLIENLKYKVDIDDVLLIKSVKKNDESSEDKSKIKAPGLWNLSTHISVLKEK